MKPSDRPGASSTLDPSDPITPAPKGRQRGSQPQEWTVYVHERGKKPRKVGSHPMSQKLPAVIKIDGKSYYLGTADITDRWLSYTDMKVSA